MAVFPVLKHHVRLGLATVAVLAILGFLGFVGPDLLAKKSPQARRLAAQEGSLIHICLSSDDTDLRPAAVAIRSTYLSASNPERLRFHFITTPEYAPLFQDLFRIHLEGIPVQVYHDAKVQAHIQSLVSFRRSSKARKVLASPFNFAPFYLPEFLNGRSGGSRINADRLIYIDTDTVLLGDVGELQSMDMQGKTCAAVEYCLQHMEDYIQFDTLIGLGHANYDPQACIANRGLLVIDVQQWKQANLTGKIEYWLEQYRTAKGDLWLGGMSQPPWLLAMNGDYHKLGDAWNCNSLGRDSMSMQESHSLRSSGFDHKALRVLGVDMARYGQILPYVVTCSATGKMLHYNGAVKPWKIDSYTKMAPVCALPQSLQQRQWTWSRSIRVFCEPTTFVSCPEIWTSFISEEVACALQDFDKEWEDDQMGWNNLWQGDKDSAEQQVRKEYEEKERLRLAQAAAQLQGGASGTA